MPQTPDILYIKELEKTNVDYGDTSRSLRLGQKAVLEYNAIYKAFRMGLIPLLTKCCGANHEF